ncbi:hypothetical protein C8J56DRAFT_893230 [Mycena floridula]|nr:hypothetical protein C8J56DRAFT_893230 [Mycena floridula]
MTQLPNAIKSGLVETPHCPHAADPDVSLAATIMTVHPRQCDDPRKEIVGYLQAKSHQHDFIVYIPSLTYKAPKVASDVPDSGEAEDEEIMSAIMDLSRRESAASSSSQGSLSSSSISSFSSGTSSPIALSSPPLSPGPQDPKKTAGAEAEQHQIGLRPSLLLPFGIPQIIILSDYIIKSSFFLLDLFSSHGAPSDVQRIRGLGPVPRPASPALSDISSLSSLSILSAGSSGHSNMTYGTFWESKIPSMPSVPYDTEDSESDNRDMLPLFMDVDEDDFADDEMDRIQDRWARVRVWVQQEINAICCETRYLEVQHSSLMSSRC